MDLEALREQGLVEGWTFTVGENSATDRSLDELCGLVVPEDWWVDADFDPCPPRRGLPESFDWRDLGGCTPVKNQGGCGSCWAFGTVGALECNILIKDLRTVDLSEQWLVSCNTNGWGCGGGWWAHDYHEWKVDQCGETGAVLEEEFPYVASDAPCNCPYPREYWIDDWAFVGSGSGVPPVHSIKQAIMDYGPVSVAVYANSAMQGYTGDIFNGCGSGTVNHAVVLVGWDDNQGPEGVWFMRNSWGPGWGENGGYMRIPYDCSSIGYAACYVNYTARDCNNNGIPDVQDILDETSDDCNDNWIPDECEPDCNENGIADECDIRDGTSEDCPPGNGVPDECEPDCNENGVPDSCDCFDGTSEDCQGNLVPDECEPDCNGNGVADECDILFGPSEDCNDNIVPDECDIADCPPGTPACDDCNENNIPDECDIAEGTSQDLNDNGVPDECDPNRTIVVDDNGPFDPAPGDPTASDPEENGTWEHPYDAIQEAINVSVSGDTIVVADGLYTGDGNRYLSLVGRSVNLKSENGPASCTIDAQGAGQVLFLHDGETRDAVIEGFTITNGNGSNGGAIYCNGSSPTIHNCVITGNTANTSGGGIFCSFDSSPLISNCVITDNSSSLSGGGVYCFQGSNASIQNCLIAGNEAGSRGGGVYVAMSDVGIHNSTLAGNTAGTSGGAVFCDVDGSVVVANCILWDDGAPQGPEMTLGDHTSWITVTYCDVAGGQDGVSDSVGFLAWGAGNLDNDPLFADAGAGDYDLTLGSPCIDAGDNMAVPLDAADMDGDGDVTERIPFDLDGNPRFVDDPDASNSGVSDPPDYVAIADMGADEFQGVCVWDMDGNNIVDPFDSNFVLARFGCAVGMGDPACDKADVDGNGVVDPFDSNAVMAHFGPCP